MKKSFSISHYPQLRQRQPAPTRLCSTLRVSVRTSSRFRHEASLRLQGSTLLPGRACLPSLALARQVHPLVIGRKRRIVRSLRPATRRCASQSSQPASHSSRFIASAGPRRLGSSASSTRNQVVLAGSLCSPLRSLPFYLTLPSPHTTLPSPLSLSPPLLPSRREEDHHHHHSSCQLPSNHFATAPPLSCLSALRQRQRLDDPILAAAVITFSTTT